MNDFEPLIGEWRADGEIPMEPPMKVSGKASSSAWAHSSSSDRRPEIDFPITYVRK